MHVTNVDPTLLPIPTCLRMFGGRFMMAIRMMMITMMMMKLAVVVVVKRMMIDVKGVVDSYLTIIRLGRSDYILNIHR